MQAHTCTHTHKRARTQARTYLVILGTEWYRADCPRPYGIHCPPSMRPLHVHRGSDTNTSMHIHIKRTHICTSTYLVNICSEWYKVDCTASSTVFTAFRPCDQYTYTRAQTHEHKHTHIRKRAHTYCSEWYRVDYIASPMVFTAFCPCDQYTYTGA